MAAITVETPTEETTQVQGVLVSPYGSIPTTPKKPSSALESLSNIFTKSNVQLETEKREARQEAEFRTEKAVPVLVSQYKKLQEAGIPLEQAQEAALARAGIKATPETLFQVKLEGARQDVEKQARVIITDKVDEEGNVTQWMTNADLTDSRLVQERLETLKTELLNNVQGPEHMMAVSTVLEKITAKTWDAHVKAVGVSVKGALTSSTNREIKEAATKATALGLLTPEGVKTYGQVLHDADTRLSQLILNKAQRKKIIISRLEGEAMSLIEQGKTIEAHRLLAPASLPTFLKGGEATQQLVEARTGLVAYGLQIRDNIERDIKHQVATQVEAREATLYRASATGDLDILRQARDDMLTSLRKNVTNLENNPSSPEYRVAVRVFNHMHQFSREDADSKAVHERAESTVRQTIVVRSGASDAALESDAYNRYREEPWWPTEDGGPKRLHEFTKKEWSTVIANYPGLTIAAKGRLIDELPTLVHQNVVYNSTEVIREQALSGTVSLYYEMSSAKPDAPLPGADFPKSERDKLNRWLKEPERKEDFERFKQVTGIPLTGTTALEFFTMTDTALRNLLKEAISVTTYETIRRHGYTDLQGWGNTEKTTKTTLEDNLRGQFRLADSPSVEAVAKGEAAKQQDEAAKRAAAEENRLKDEAAKRQAEAARQQDVMEALGPATQAAATARANLDNAKADLAAKRDELEAKGAELEALNSFDRDQVIRNYFTALTRDNPGLFLADMERGQRREDTVSQVDKHVANYVEELSKEDVQASPFLTKLAAEREKGGGEETSKLVSRIVYTLEEFLKEYKE